MTSDTDIKKTTVEIYVLIINVATIIISRSLHLKHCVNIFTSLGNDLLNNKDISFTMEFITHHTYNAIICISICLICYVYLICKVKYILNG